MRRHKHEDHVNHEAWAIPYADLMTLLLAFFVVMYAVSVVNEGKFRVMSESLIEAFNGSSHAVAPLPPTRVRPHNVNPAIATPAGQAGSAAVPIAVPIPPHPVALQGGNGRDIAHQAAPPANLKRIEGDVRKALQALIDRKQVVVRNNGQWLEIEIRTDILFPSGVAQLSVPAQGVLHNLAAVLAAFANPLRVEGFTDDVPINTALYPSNWELSAARAGSVARLFVNNGIVPDRLGIIGWGEMHPVADNDTVEGRNENRRVLVVVMGDNAAPQREHSNIGELDRQPGIVEGTTPGMLPAVQVIAPLLPASRTPTDESAKDTSSGTPAVMAGAEVPVVTSPSVGSSGGMSQVRAVP